MRNVGQHCARVSEVKQSEGRNRLGAATKHCYACDTEKPRSHFYTCRRTKDGKQSQCKVCQGGQVKPVLPAPEETLPAQPPRSLPKRRSREEGEEEQEVALWANREEVTGA